MPFLDDLCDDDVLERESIIGAQTRLSGPSARVVLLECDDELLSATSLLFKDERLPTDVARWLLDRSVSISHHALLAHVAAGPSGRMPKAFARLPHCAITRCFACRTASANGSPQAALGVFVSMRHWAWSSRGWVVKR